MDKINKIICFIIETYLYLQRKISQINIQMEKSIKLTDKEAIELYKTADESWKKVLEKNWDKKILSGKILDRVKTWQDVLDEAGKDDEEVVPYSKPRGKKQKSQNAFARIQLLSEVLNEGVILDWSNRDQPKYYPYFEKKNGVWVVDSYLYYHFDAFMGCGFYYKDAETALFAGKQFLEIYSEYLPE